MTKLSDPRVTRELVSRFDFGFRKRFGQNFLVDEGVIRCSLEAADVTKNDVIFEVGPGIGTLTQYLCEAAGQVVSIEIDKKLIPILEETLADYENVEVINEDVLKVDLLALAKRYDAGRAKRAEDDSEHNTKCPENSEECSGSDAAQPDRCALHPLKIVANLPYYITTPILMNLFRKKVPAQSITVMVQKEVAQRMTAQPGSKDYGSLSIAVQYYSDPRIVELVPPSSFIPHPKVTSAVVTMDLYEELPVQPREEELFLAISRAAFEQRRKTLVNALGSNTTVPYSKDQVTAALTAMGLSPSVRGEKLSIEEFAKLSDALSGSN